MLARSSSDASNVGTDSHSTERYFKDVFRTLADAIEEASVAVFQVRASRTVSHKHDLLQHGQILAYLATHG